MAVSDRDITRIESRVDRLEARMDERLDEIKELLLDPNSGVAARLQKLETGAALHVAEDAKGLADIKMSVSKLHQQVMFVTVIIIAVVGIAAPTVLPPILKFITKIL